MNRLRIVPRNFHDESSLSAELSPVDGYALENTQNVTRSRVWRSSDGTDQYVAGTFDDDVVRSASFFGFFRHRCHGAQVRLQLFSDAGFVTQVYDSGANDVINVVPTDGMDWGTDPYGTGSIDPFITEAPYWLWFDPTDFLSYRISFSSVSTAFGYDYFQVSRFFLGRYMEVAINPDYGANLSWANQSDRNRSRGGSLRTNLGAWWRTMKMDFNSLSDDDRAAWLDIMRYCGMGRDFVISLFPEEGSRRERDHFMNAKFSSLDPIVRQSGYLTKQIQMEEV